MSFVPGQRVVCIESDWRADGNPLWAISTYPVKGTIYTIREELIDPKFQRWIYVRLCEIVNPPKQTGFGIHEEAFLGKCFRPVDETKLEIFRAMLVTPPKEVVDA